MRTSDHDNTGHDSHGHKIRLTKRLIGQILLDAGFITRQDLDAALETQWRTNEPLGEILLKKGVLKPQELNAVLAIQRDLATLKDALSAAAGNPQPLGELLLSAGRISSKDLEDALSDQAKISERLGQIFLKKGIITADELDAVLEFQRCQRQAPGETGSRCRLGEILVAAGRITRDQLQDALVIHKDSGKKIGVVLVEAGYVEPHHVEHALGIQKRLVAAALAAALALSGSVYAPPALAVEASGSLHGSAKVFVSAVVRPHVSLKVMRQPHELVITHADTLRGYVYAPSAAMIEVKNNSRGGYLLAFVGLSEPFKEVFVDGLSQVAHITSDGGWVLQPDAGRAPVTVQLGYRFILSKDAMPGTYSWPLAVSVSPL